MSRTCHKCGTRWPNGKDYHTHPECKRITIISPLVSIDEKLAHWRMTHTRFRDWLVEHDRLDPIEELEQIPVQEQAA